MSRAKEPSLQTGGAGEAAVAGHVAGHLVICVAEYRATANRLYGGVIAVKNGAAHRHDRGAAVALVRLDAGQSVRGDDDAHYAYGYVSRAAHSVDSVACVEAHRTVGNGDVDRAGTSGTVGPHTPAGAVADAYPIENNVCRDAAGRLDQDPGTIVENRRVLNDQIGDCGATGTRRKRYARRRKSPEHTVLDVQSRAAAEHDGRAKAVEGEAV